jgi:hypothetical protein
MDKLIDRLCKLISRLDYEGKHHDAALVYNAVIEICRAHDIDEPIWADYQIVV